MNKSMIKMLLGLHAMLMIYSMSGICSKLAAGEKFLSIRFRSVYKELHADHETGLLTTNKG